MAGRREASLPLFCQLPGPAPFVALGEALLREWPPRAARCGEHICEDMGFDSLSYQSLQGMIEAIGIDPEKICTYCWDGRG